MELDDLAARVAAVAAEHADSVDREGRFPAEAIALARETGLLACCVPRALGGSGGTYRELASVSGQLGAACLSTALIWGMHSQQLLVLRADGGPVAADLLREVASHGLLVASVTSEEGSGGDLFTVRQAMAHVDGGIRIDRYAPIVSYLAHAGLLLISMRAAAEAPMSDVRLAVVRPFDGRVESIGTWDAMGMRGTCSTAARIAVQVSADRLLATDYRRLMLVAMIPAGHVAWSAAWLSSASGAMRRVLRWLRGRTDPGRRLDSESLLARLAEQRMRLDLCHALLERLVSRLDQLECAGAALAEFEDPTLRIELNSLKMASSETAFDVVASLVEVVGVSEGYRLDGRLGLNRAFRDLGSASLMFNNERLRQANGRLLIVEK